MKEDHFDVIVIGSGPGGYVAAIRAAQLGMKTACIEKQQTLGGTCLNIGCIPSKSLLTSSEKFIEAQKHLAIHGVKIEKMSLDLAAMMAHKDKVVKDNTSGIVYLFRKHGITHITGHGQLSSPNSVIVSQDGKQQTLNARAIILATGSEHSHLTGVDIDEECIVSSTGALSLSEVPKRLAVIGGGYIGLEMGSVWQRLGAEVTVFEFLDRILPGMDAEIAKKMKQILTRQGIAFKLSTKVLSAHKSTTEGIDLIVEPTSGGPSQTFQADVVLVAIGRIPYTKNLGLETVGIQLDNKRRIITDDNFRTNSETVYAIGDVIKGPMLAHKAEDEGIICSEIIAGHSGHITYEAIPSVVYTAPEVAQVGHTEENLQALGIDYKIGKFPFSANGRARALATTDGLVKILADAGTDRVLGAHILGPDAGHLIAEIGLAMEFSASAEDIARTCHAHPTLNEAIKEAALAVDKRPIHI